MIELIKKSGAIELDKEDTNINLSKPTLKGDKGDKGDDGFSPVVDVEPTDKGHKVTITDAEGAKEFEVLNGKDAEGGNSGGALVVKYKYCSNDWVTGAIMSDTHGSGELNFCTFEALPDNTYVLDISVRYNGADYRLNELSYKYLANPMSIVSVYKKPVYDEIWGADVVGKLYNETDGAIYLEILSLTGAVEGFTVYYTEIEEIEVREE